MEHVKSGDVIAADEAGIAGDDVIAWWFADGDGLTRCPGCAVEVIGDQPVFRIEVAGGEVANVCDVCNEPLIAREES